MARAARHDDLLQTRQDVLLERPARRSELVPLLAQRPAEHVNVPARIPLVQELVLRVRVVDISAVDGLAHARRKQPQVGASRTVVMPIGRRRIVDHNQHRRTVRSDRTSFRPRRQQRLTCLTPQRDSVALFEPELEAVGRAERRRIVVQQHGASSQGRPNRKLPQRQRITKLDQPAAALARGAAAVVPRRVRVGEVPGADKGGAQRRRGNRLDELGDAQEVVLLRTQQPMIHLVRRRLKCTMNNRKARDTQTLLRTYFERVKTNS